MKKKDIFTVSHASIFFIQKGGFLQPVLLKYLKKIVCVSLNKDDEPCNVCDYCKKILNNTYYDLIKVDFKEKFVNKNDILEIKNRFSNNGLERINKKIYVIFNLELGNLQVFNSLLKFLETPPTNTYAILVVDNFLSLPSTIVSRCQLFYVKNNSGIWKKILTDNNLSKKDILCLKEMFWSADSAINSLENGVFKNLKFFAESILDMNINDIKKIKVNFDNFKKISYYEIEKIINCLFVLTDDIYLKKNLLNLVGEIRNKPCRSLIFNKLLGVINKNELW